MKVEKREGSTESFTSSDAPKTEENFLANLINQTALRLKEQYNYSDEKILEICTKERESEHSIPLEIFAVDLAPNESLVKYIKETFDMNYHDIAELLKGNERSIWASYQRAAEKMPAKFSIKNPTLIPISVFQNPDLSVLEALLVYLKDRKNWRGVKIAKLLNKHPANIWTIYTRAKKKLK